MVVSFGPATLVAYVPVECPGATLVGEQSVHDLFDGTEAREHVGRLAVVLAVDECDVDGVPVEPQLDPLRGFLDLDIDPAAAIAALAGAPLALFVSGPPALAFGLRH